MAGGDPRPVRGDGPPRAAAIGAVTMAIHHAHKGRPPIMNSMPMIDTSRFAAMQQQARQRYEDSRQRHNQQQGLLLGYMGTVRNLSHWAPSNLY
jgi:exopolyphosphatase/pppGpp-phosphohydrolase